LGYVKRLLPPAAAEFYIETALDSLILLRKINESSAVSNYYLARSAEKILYIPPKVSIYQVIALGNRHLDGILIHNYHFFRCKKDF
jgi:hypothetical protein